MLKIIVVAFLFTVSGTVSAKSEVIDTSGLSDAQVAEIREKAAALQKSLGSPTKAKEVAEWVEVGSNIGKGLAGAAREVGVAVNDFVDTPVGKMTAAVILFKFIGGPLLHLIGGIIILIAGGCATRFIAHRFVKTKIEYSPDKTDMFGRARILRVERGELMEEAAFGVWIMAIATVMAATIALFSY